LRSGFVHQGCIYGSDEEFLAMAVPFLEEGLDRGEPVLAATTAANLALLSRAMGARAQRVDYAETAYFGRRPPQRIAAFDRYWRHHAAAADGGQVRILAEPVWAGRSQRQITAWKRMESALNVVLAGTNIWMICPYDTRAVDPDVAAVSRQTHPALMDGRQPRACPEFTDPAVFVDGVDATPLPEAPADAVATAVDGDLSQLRRLVATQAGVYGLGGERVSLLVMAANEVAGQLLRRGGGALTARTWQRFGAIVCELRSPAARITDPFVGWRPPGTDPQADVGLWVVQQLCDEVEIRSGEAGCTVRLHVPSLRAQDP
jgi:MEDS: MEthanogen/methylotroph, DcmR Sensory domain